MRAICWLPVRFPFRSTRARVALFVSLLFVAAFGVSGLATFLVISRPVEETAQARLAREAGVITTLVATKSFSNLAKLVQDRERGGERFLFRLANAQHQRIAGDLPEQAYVEGFSTVLVPVRGPASGEADFRIRVLTVPLANGAQLSLGEDLSRSRALQFSFLRVFILSAGAALFVALAAGLSYVNRILARIEVIADTADAVSEGRMTLRAPVRPADRRDDIDHLALAMNRMLNEIENLVISVRQVSDDVAHDLRTPLAHLKQRVELALAGPPDPVAMRAALEGASEKIDEVLATFEALLRIGQLEAGANLAAFQKLDLSEIAARVVEAFRPSAEDAGHGLVLHAPRNEYVSGEPSLLAQLIANLVENSLIHTPTGSSLEVRVETLGRSVRLTVEDDGPGVGAVERERIFQRFYRGDRSRTTPGSGLGLSLAAAVARAHHAEIKAEDAGPGLRIRIDFPPWDAPEAAV